MTYQQTLDYMYSRLPMFSRIGASAIKPDITNTLILCERIGNPQNDIRSVHIAGTNGKGSTSHMIAAVFQSAGYKTGLYTSPHLKDFRERIRVDGEMIPEQEVIDFIARIQPVIEEINPSFFEITVAMALNFFRSQNVDVAIIETGLGGRLDSTNIILPDLSVITNIGMDHMNILGDTIEQIAFEKAGIIKPGVPAVIGAHQAGSAAVFEAKASEMNAPIFFADAFRFVSDWKYEHHLLTSEVTTIKAQTKDFYALDLLGLYQHQNLVTVLEAISVLRTKGWNITEQALHHGLANVKKLTGLRGRWETVHQHPHIVFDVGHNVDGLRAIAAQLEVTSYHHLRIVIGMVKDKEITKAVALLPKTATYYFTQARIPRALADAEMAAQGHAAGLEGDHYPDVNTALHAALAHAHKDDLVLVCGSVFVVGDVDLELLKA